MTVGPGRPGATAKVVLVTYGSAGDVRPLAALGQRLNREGLQVGVCAPPDSRDLLAARGLTVTPLGSNVRQLMQAYAGRFVAQPLAATVPMTRLTLPPLTGTLYNSPSPGLGKCWLRRSSRRFA